MIVYPANFAMRTGDLHFSLLQRGRAVDTQCFIAACGTATNTDDKELF